MCAKSKLERVEYEDVRAAIELIEQARTAHTPALSKRAAAARAGFSEAHWRNVVKGTARRRGQDHPVSITPETIARMANAVGVSAEELRNAGEKSAADMLTGIDFAFGVAADSAPSFANADIPTPQLEHLAHLTQWAARTLIDVAARSDADAQEQMDPVLGALINGMLEYATLLGRRKDSTAGSAYQAELARIITERAALKNYSAGRDPVRSSRELSRESAAQRAALGFASREDDRLEVGDEGTKLVVRKN